MDHIIQLDENILKSSVKRPDLSQRAQEYPLDRVASKRDETARKRSEENSGLTRLRRRKESQVHLVLFFRDITLFLPYAYPWSGLAKIGKYEIIRPPMARLTRHHHILS